MWNKFISMTLQMSYNNVILESYFQDILIGIDFSQSLSLVSIHVNTLYNLGRHVCGSFVDLPIGDET